jgi:OmcA/MtrC family decaheme c-type cytochrome
MTCSRSRLPSALAALAALVLAGCSGSDGPQGPKGEPGDPGVPADPAPTPTTLTKFDDPPGVHLAITQVSGGSLVSAADDGNNFQPGDTITLTFTLTKDDGSAWGLAEMSAMNLLVSGPSFNYQRVLPEQTDVIAKAVKVGEGTWTYTFPAPIPETYLPPYNDTPSFGEEYGELQGQPLLDGTYTVGMYGDWTYTVDGVQYTQAGNAEMDFLLGPTATLLPHQVVTRENCNQCHVSLRAHGGVRQDIKLCVLCHTSGAEDLNDATAGGTPGVSIDFRVMIHRLHDGAHLPSVNGVSTNDDGTRNYDAPPKPFQIVGAGDIVRDFSKVNYPVWPPLNSGLPKDLGYSALTSAHKAQEDKLRTSVPACLKCHGDPDGVGPLPAPADGDLYKEGFSEAACGSCHDDVDWHKPYTKNGQTMPPQQDIFIACNGCHASQGDFMSVVDGHLHPLDDPAQNPGVVVNVSSVTGGTGPGGNFQAGDAPVFHFSLADAKGNALPLPRMDSATAMLTGPTYSQQIITPYSGSNGVGIEPYDFAGRLQSANGTNKGAMSKVVPANVAETLTVEFGSATSFNVTGSASGSLGSGALPASPSTNPPGSSISGLVLASTAAAQNVTVAFSDPTHFTVTGSVAGTSGSGTLSAATNTSTRFVSPDGKLSFDLSVGPNAFSAGNSIFLRVFKGSAADPVLFAIVAGRTSFSGTAPAPDRFYDDVVPSAPSYTLTLPMDISTEDLGDGNGAIGQTLVAANLPVDFGRQQLSEVIAAADPTTLTAAVAPYDRFADVASTAGYTTIAPDNVLVLDPGAGVGAREFLQVALVENGTRLWFRTPARYAHASGGAVLRATLGFLQEGASNQYTLDPATGAITSGVAFGAGTALLMSYRTDGRFGWKRHLGDALQAVYQPPPNDSNALGKASGEWTGLPFVDGTYTASLWLGTNVDVATQGEQQSYRATAVAANANLLYGPSATTLEPHAVIASPETCNRCHSETQFHGSDAGFQSCAQCHSLAGAEDLPTYANSTVPATTGTTIDFRNMLHKVHMGQDVADASSYAVVGSDGNPANWAGVVFPSMPGGVLNCFTCHGDDNQNWKVPADRDYPTGQTPTVHEWASACASCHAAEGVTAHIDANTAPNGAEACIVCHGPGKEEAVDVVHKPR